MKLEQLVQYANAYIPDTNETLILEKAYTDSQVFEEDQDNLEKGRVAAPVGTVKMVGNAEYIKTADGWRYHTSGHRSSVQNHFKTKGQALPAHLSGDMGAYKKNTESTKFSVKEGSTLTAKDGTKGEVIAHDGHNATVKFTPKGGKEQTVQVDATKLEHNITAGGVKHQASKDSLEQEKDAKHEDNDDNIRSAAELEKKPTPKAKPKPAKGSVGDLLKEQGLDPDKFSDIMNQKGLSDSEKLSLIAIRVSGGKNKKGTITKKDTVKKADIFTGSLVDERKDLIKSTFN